jgi:phospholipase C
MRALNRLSPTKFAKEKTPGRYCDGGGLYLLIGNDGVRSWIRFQLNRKVRDMGLGAASIIGLPFWPDSSCRARMPQIDHVIVLMLENRSFDSILGRLYPERTDFDGIPPGAFNMAGGVKVEPWTSDPGDGTGNFTIPTPDPGESFANMTEQIFGAGKSPPAAPTMEGFAENYATASGGDPKNVMHGFTPEQLPVISALAKNFAVSDRWFASAPNQTWPNRFFAHTGTAYGYVNNSPIHPPYMMDTIFNRLTQVQRSWRIYYHDFPQTATLTRIWSELPDHLYSFEDHFMVDAMAGRLPNYTFIEPRYFADPLFSRLPNDQHPPHDAALSERLIARCYDAIRNGAGWSNSLFIITYDEHGGNWDHVPPPSAISPDDRRPDGFAFDRYGARVPAVLISPWIPAGTIARPPAGGPPFDHTSILATLRDLFGPFEPLSRRDASAPNLLEILSLDEPTNNGPRQLALPTPQSSPRRVGAAAARPATAAQNVLAALADVLPAGVAKTNEHASILAELFAAGKVPLEMTSEGALQTVKDGLRRFLGGVGMSVTPPR